jgi:hypothetical protein
MPNEKKTFKPYFGNVHKGIQSRIIVLINQVTEGECLLEFKFDLKHIFLTAAMLS